MLDSLRDLVLWEVTPCDPASQMLSHEAPVILGPEH